MKYYGIGRHKSAVAKVFITVTEAEVTEAEVTEAEVTEAEVTEAKVTEAKVTEAEVTEAKVTEAKVTEAEVTEAEIIINNKTISDYLQNDKDAIHSIKRFLTFDNIDIPILNIRIQVSGGGNTGQQKAICLALARTFYQMGFSDIIKKKNLLTQDSRVKERRKYGLKKARKAPQYSKR